MALAIDTEELPTAPVRSPSPDAGPRQSSLRAEIAALSRLDLDGLRLRWRNETRRSAPPHLPKYLLLRMLAYRIQANVLGDLDPETKRALDRVARDQKRAASNSARGRPPPRALKPGTTLVREWEGELHRVAIVADGFTWGGKTYASLSIVAKAITGTQWSGPRFFGLLNRKSGQAATGETEPLKEPL
jgi:hypothetical protein